MDLMRLKPNSWEPVFVSALTLLVGSFGHLTRKNLSSVKPMMCLV